MFGYVELAPMEGMSFDYNSSCHYILTLDLDPFAESAEHLRLRSTLSLYETLARQQLASHWDQIIPAS